MARFTLLIAFLSVLAIACATAASQPDERGERQAAPLQSTADPTMAAATLVPAATETLTASATPPPVQEAFTPEAPVPTPTFFSEVLGADLPPPVAQAPEPTPVPGGGVLPLPEGTSVVWGGCSSDGECHWFNFYWAPTHEVVMQDGESQIKVQHELCHAHQHWSINGGAPLEPSDYDLESWSATAQGQSFTSAVSGLSWPWSQSAVNGLEDFAWTCAYWYVDPQRLLDTSPERYRWAAGNLP